MEEIRILRDEEYMQAIKLADLTFRREGLTSMSEAFPYSFTSALSQSFGAIVDGVLVSFIGLVPAIVNIGPAAVNVYLLGQVCTTEAARGQGYASKVMDALLTHIRQTDASLLLVSGSRSLYERNACLPFGTMHQVIIQREWAQTHSQPDSSTLIRKCNERDWFGIKRCADLRQVRFEYSIIDLAILIKAQARASCFRHSHQVIVAEEEGIITGFLIFTIPQKTTIPATRIPEAIEWAGSAEIVIQLMAHAIRSQELEQLKVSIPHHEKELLFQLQGAEMEEKVFPSTLHVIHAERLLHQLQPYFQTFQCARIQNSLVEQLGIGKIKMTVNNMAFLMSPQQFVDELFTIGSFNDSFMSYLFPQGEECFPIPLPSPHGLLYV